MTMGVDSTNAMPEETSWTPSFQHHTSNTSYPESTPTSGPREEGMVTTQTLTPSESSMPITVGPSQSKASPSTTIPSTSGESALDTDAYQRLSDPTSYDVNYETSTVQYNTNRLDPNITGIRKVQPDHANNIIQAISNSIQPSTEYFATSDYDNNSTILQLDFSSNFDFNTTGISPDRGAADNSSAHSWWSNDDNNNDVTNGIHATMSSGPEVFRDWGTKSWIENESVHQSSLGNRIGIGIGDQQRGFDSPQELVFKVSILVLISVFGSVGNLLVIGSIIKTRHLHRPPFYFLLSMAATDLSRAGFCVPVVMATTLQGSTWGHGAAACKLFAFATSFFVFSSILSLLAIAIDRHVSIVYSKAYRRRCHGLIVLIAALSIWIIAFCISFPPVVGSGEYVFIQEEAQCAFKHRHYARNDGVASVMLFLAIMFLACFLYFRIYRFMRSHRRMRPLQHQPARSSNWTFVGPGANGQAFINWLNGFGGQTVNRQTGQRTVQRLNFGRVVNLSTSKNEHLTRLFLTLTCVFGVLWTPYVVVSLWRIFLDHVRLPSGFVTSAAWTSYCQVALSPLTYFLARGKVRRTARTIQACADDRREFLLENKTRK